MGTAPHPVVRPACRRRSLPLDDIRFLSDDRLGGRLTGSPGADTAAAYLARRFQAVGLQPAAGGWFQTLHHRARRAGGAARARGGAHRAAT